METSPATLTKGGEFIIKSFDPQDIFTPEDFSEEQIMMKDAVKEFIDREVVPNKAQFEKKDYALTQRLMQQAGSLGFLSVSVPEAYGGLGMDFVSTMLVCDYISGATGSFSTAFGAHTGIGTLPVTLYGTEEQKMKKNRDENAKPSSDHTWVEGSFEEIEQKEKEMRFILSEIGETNPLIEKILFKPLKMFSLLHFGSIVFNEK